MLEPRIRESVDAYVEPDASARMRHLERACADDVHLRTAGKLIEGRGELDALIADFQRRQPGARAAFASASDVGRIRFLLTFVGATVPPR